MPGRILIADPIATNRIMMRVTLEEAYYDVSVAATGKEVMTHVAEHPTDLVIAAQELSDVTGAELCEMLHATRIAAALPVILLCDGPGPQACCDALAGGADDCLPRPVDDLVLLARMRSLLRSRDAEAELRLRDDTQRALGLAEDQAEFAAPPRVVFIAPAGANDLDPVIDAVRQRLRGKFSQMSPEAAMRDPDGTADVFVMIEDPRSSGATLSLLSEMRANTATRHAAILYVANGAQTASAATALDLGANDLMANGLYADELILRLQRQVTRKRTADRLRANMQVGLRAALTDPLTGLYNRRYALPHLDRLARTAHHRGREAAVLVIDLDHFKAINDTHGHAAGDQVLTAVARHLGDRLRAADLVARLGGEEFLVVMPDADADSALRIAKRLCSSLSRLRVPAQGLSPPLRVTASLGVAVTDPGVAVTGADLIQRADRAMYRAKKNGRNRVEIDRPPPARDTTVPPMPLDRALQNRA
ncbi:diguanylate cyclase [Aestuariicoccus sp. MJ-SS9]|uniref:diguanylate cyclase n=1 Tax=Aestuariicoccus sp. MJ-SS9 TaxID=3079855 RepID=UPI002915B0D1|nr:diguanylate cyclase [Aestuariicoccus sp. MJ-SS9]MDU8909971.1 diguanylate cyclase [Aestuariicoccus sp. MJ-SS9]